MPHITAKAAESARLSSDGPHSPTDNGNWSGIPTYPLGKWSLVFGRLTEIKTLESPINNCFSISFPKEKNTLGAQDLLLCSTLYRMHSLCLKSI